MTLRSFVSGQWTSGTGVPSMLQNPSTEETIATADTTGVDFAAAVDHARQVGLPALRTLSFAARGKLLLDASKAIHACRDELIGLAIDNGGNTRGDAKFDIDGAIGTLAAYAELGQKLGETTYLRDGEGTQPTRSTKLWGEHLWLSRLGVAVHINAFNFPAWGLCEKAAVAWLAGLPVISKPATSTALVAHRIVEVLLAKGCLPPGTLSLLCGSVGDLLSHLTEQDVLAFTGSSDTARILRSRVDMLGQGTRLNVEADSLNVALLGPDGAPGSELSDLFLQEVCKDITQKAGQKCTAIRRILVPMDRLDAIAADLVDRISALRIGNPRDEGVQLGPLATRSQLHSVRAGMGTLLQDPGVTTLTGGAAPVADSGFFVAPTLLLAKDPHQAKQVHRLEVFGPCATIMGYRDLAELAALVNRGGGGLVASVYSDDRRVIAELLPAIGPYHGRLYLGSGRLLGQTPGPGTALPAMNHGGPGHAGGGHELGGVRGLELYMQRCAVMGYKPIVEGLLPKGQTAPIGPS